MCSIHELFYNGEDKAHNCIGCNLADYTKLMYTAIENLNINSPIEAFSSTILYAYLLVERFEEIFKIVELHKSYRLKHFQVFVKIRRWANFLKHPKAFMFVHHPIYYFENDVTIEDADSDSYIFIDQSFIDEYYSDGEKNTKLYKTLSNKKDVIVLLPDYSELIHEFCAAQKKFIELISKNEVFRELLDGKSTLKNYFEGES